MAVVKTRKNKSSEEAVSDILVFLFPSSIADRPSKARFLCPESGCDKTFKTSKGRHNHQIGFHQGKPCHVCGKQLSSPTNLKRHLITHTTVKDRFPCLEPGCDKSFKTIVDRDQHQLGVHEGKWAVDCPECGRTLKSLYILKGHMATHVKERLSTCNVCKESFTSSQMLETHMRRRHEKVQDFCDECNINIRGFGTLEEHMLRHQKRPDLVCDHCNIIFNDSRALQGHLRFINGETPYQCDECDRAYPTVTALRNHRNGNHGHKHLVCDIDNCGEAFAKTHALRDHKVGCHGKTGYKCHICQKEYKSVQNMDDHIRQHKGDTPHACSFPGCDKAFTTPFRLHQHFRNHIQFRCHKCYGMFDTAVARHEHNVTCSRYWCRQCGSRGPRDEYENHRANCSLSKFLESRSKQGTRTDDDFQIAANTLQEFLETNKIEVSSRANTFRPLWESRSPNLFFIDTEFAGDVLLEVCVMTTNGEAIVDTLVNHQTQIQTVYDRSENDIQRHAVDKIYGNERDRHTSGMTMKQIAETLINKGFGPESILVEWSFSRCDYWMLFRLFEQIGLEHVMPPKFNSWLLLFDWKDVVQKSKAALDCRLSVLFLVLQPADVWVVRQAHRAGPDTLMLLKMTQLYFDYATKLRQKTQAKIMDFFQ